MDCHNFSFGTGYEIFDKNGNLMESKFDSAKPEVEGEIEIEVKDSEGKVKHKHKQPMRSFTVGALYSLILGKNIAPNSDYCIGGGSKVVEVSDITVQTNIPFNYIFNNLSFVVSNIDIQNAIVEVVLEGRATGSYWVRELGLPIYRQSFSGNIIDIVARERVPDFRVESGNTYKIKWTIQFPNSNKVFTKNFIYSYFQKLSQPFTNYQNINGDYKTSTNSSPSYSIFMCNPASNQNVGVISRTQNQTNKGIVVGSSDTNISTNDYCLNSLIAGGTQQGNLVYSTMQTMSSVTIQDNTAFGILYRDFFNSSNSESVTIREAGLIGYSQETNNGLPIGSYLLAHWLTGEIVLQPNQTLRVYFQPTVTA